MPTSTASGQYKTRAVSVLAGLLISGAVLLLLRWMASEVFEGETAAFDVAVRTSVHALASPSMTAFFIAMSFVGSPAFLACAGIIAFGIFLYVGWKRQIVMMASVMAGEVLLDIVLKHVYERARPEPYFDYPLPASFSFPSGHALGSICFYGILALLLASQVSGRLRKAAIFLAAATIILLIGTSRIYLGVHYPTDVLAGYITGAVWIAAVWLSFRFFRTRTA